VRLAIGGCICQRLDPQSAMGQQLGSDCTPYLEQGQQLSNECHCQDGSFWHMCSPEDPQKEAQNTFQNPIVPGYPTEALSERHEDDSMRLAMSLSRDDCGFVGSAAEEVSGYCSAPSPDSEPRLPRVELRPASREHTATSNSPPRREVSVEDILTDLLGAEDVMYGEAFAAFPGGRNGFVTLDCATMRDFVCTNSAVSMEDIDMEFLKVALPEDGLSRDGFIQLLREFSVSDGESIMHFMGLSNDGESMGSEECRSALLLFAQQKLSCNFSDDRWERIFNTVMWDAGVAVSMEQYLHYSQLTARIVRLMRYSQVKKLAYGSQSQSKTGVRGGA